MWRLGIGLAIGLAMSAGLAGAAAAQEFRIDVDGGWTSVEAGREALEQAARGAPLTILSLTAGRAEVSGGEAALRALSAAPALRRVTASGAPAPQRRIGVVAVSVDAQGWSARWVDAWTAQGDAVPPAAPAVIGPAAAIKQGLTADLIASDGRLLASVTVEDPRTIRYEASEADGRLTSRQEFLGQGGITYIQLPATTEAATLQLRTMAADGATAFVGAANLPASPLEGVQ